MQSLVRQFGGNISTVASGENITFMCTAEGAPLPTMVVVETGAANRIVGHVPRAISSVCRPLSDL